MSNTSINPCQAGKQKKQFPNFDVRLVQEVSSSSSQKSQEQTKALSADAESTPTLQPKNKLQAEQLFVVKKSN